MAAVTWHGHGKAMTVYALAVVYAHHRLLLLLGNWVTIDRRVGGSTLALHLSRYTLKAVTHHRLLLLLGWRVGLGFRLRRL